MGFVMRNCVANISMIGEKIKFLIFFDEFLDFIDFVLRALSSTGSLRGKVAQLARKMIHYSLYLRTLCTVVVCMLRLFLRSNLVHGGLSFLDSASFFIALNLFMIIINRINPLIILITSPAILESFHLI